MNFSWEKGFFGTPDTNRPRQTDGKANIQKNRQIGHQNDKYSHLEPEIIQKMIFYLVD